MSRKHVNYEEDTHEQALQHPKYEYLQWYFPYFIFESTINKWGRNDPGRTGIGANGIRGETTRYHSGWTAKF